MTFNYIYNLLTVKEKCIKISLLQHDNLTNLLLDPQLRYECNLIKIISQEIHNINYSYEACAKYFMVWDPFVPFTGSYFPNSQLQKKYPPLPPTFCKFLKMRSFTVIGML